MNLYKNVRNPEEIIKRKTNGEWKLGKSQYLIDRMNTL